MQNKNNTQALVYRNHNGKHKIEYEEDCLKFNELNNVWITEDKCMYENSPKMCKIGYLIIFTILHNDELMLRKTTLGTLL